ncbi:MAG: hypothetical protein HY819_07260 [Acidobacteria bacterium]|nr:hypothetical protein [Acidobacteriota bacterium]
MNSISTKQLSYKLINTRKNARILNKEDLINKLKDERRKIRAQLVVGSYVDNWPYIKVLPEKLRGRLLHKLRLVDEKLLKIDKRLQKIKLKKHRLAK